MSGPMGKKFYNIDQPSAALGILNGGASVALSGFNTGNDSMSDFEGHVVGTGGASTPKGAIVQGGSNSMNVTPTYPKVTVV